MFTKNITVGGIKLGVYECPLPNCDTLPDYGSLDGESNHDDDDRMAGEMVAA